MKSQGNKQQKSQKKRWLTVATVVGLVELLFFVSQKKNRQDMAKRVKILKKDMKKPHWLKDYFIPHDGNCHQPKILHPKTVKVLTAGLLAVKIILVSLLFALYPGGAYVSPAVENEFVKLNNQYRAALGIAPLERNEYLDSVAVTRANDMLERDYFSHYTPEGKKPWEWVDKNDYDFIRFGENLAIDFVTAEAVEKAFQASPTHDKNLRNDKYEDIGVAMVSGDMEGRQTNILVVFFGTQRISALPLAQADEPVVKPAPVVVPEIVVKPADTNSAPEIKPQPVIKPQPIVEPIIPSSSTTRGDVIVNGQLQDQLAVAGLEQEAVVEPVAEQPVVVASSGTWLQRLTSWSNNFYLVIILALLIIALLNIFVAIRVQHRSTIVASIFMVALASFLYLTDWHQYESIKGAITVLGFFG